MKFIAAFMLCLAALLGVAKGAEAYCFEPSEPGCISFKVGDWSEGDFRLCKMEVEHYLSQLSNWQDCVVREANDRADKVVDKFNCYAKGQSVCF
jgi:hypothetical protein